MLYYISQTLAEYLSVTHNRLHCITFVKNKLRACLSIYEKSDGKYYLPQNLIKLFNINFRFKHQYWSTIWNSVIKNHICATDQKLEDEHKLKFNQINNKGNYIKELTI